MNSSRFSKRIKAVQMLKQKQVFVIYETVENITHICVGLKRLSNLILQMLYSKPLVVTLIDA
jgi:hypothetical protein